MRKTKGVELLLPEPAEERKEKCLLIMAKSGGVVKDSGMSASGGLIAWRAGIGCCQLRRAPNVRYPPTQLGARGVGFGTLSRECVYRMKEMKN